MYTYRFIENRIDTYILSEIAFDYDQKPLYENIYVSVIYVIKQTEYSIQTACIWNNAHYALCEARTISL